MGCGRVGSTLARSLEDRNHTVSVIDSEPDSVRRLGPGFNGDVDVDGRGDLPAGFTYDLSLIRNAVFTDTTFPASSYRYEVVNAAGAG